MRLYLLLVLFPFAFTINAEYTRIPDANFKQTLIELGVEGQPSISGQLLTTAKSPNACTIAQPELDALLDLYNSTDGPNWTSENDGDTSNDWDINNPIENWYGLTIDCDNETVTVMNLKNNNLSGNIPTSIGNFPNLKFFFFVNNNLLGAVPSSMGNLLKVQSISLNKNNLSGQLPNSFSQLAELVELYIDNNNFSGPFPDLSNNNFSWLTLNHNAFEFGDFESEFTDYSANSGVFWYAPQAKVDSEETHSIVTGENIVFTVNCSGTQNTYQWYKGTIPVSDGGNISGALSPTMTISNAQLSDAGIYHCRVLNSICTHGGSPGSGFKNLEIKRNNITLVVAAAPSLQSHNVYNYADSVIAFSSEWSTGGWDHNQTLGHFNTYPCYGDISTSWASGPSGAEREFLELYFNNAAPIDSIFIYETYNAGAVDTVYVKNPNTNTWEIVYTATPTNITSSRILKIGFPKTSFDVSEVRIAIYSLGTSWNEIDAVAINSTPDEGPDSVMIDCNNSAIVIGSSCGSSNIGDATFLWTTPNGNILSGANTAKSTIDAPGLYTLSVTKNNDVVHYDVLVTSNIESTPPTDYTESLCTGQSLSVNGTTYDANNPTGTETLTAVSGCDSIVNINLSFISGLPLLENDYLTITIQEEQKFNILNNDVLPDDYIFNINQSNHLDYFQTDSNGDLTIRSSEATSGDVLNITYQICDNFCPDLCATASVEIKFEFTQPEEVIVSDILTLNGDGKNDKLFFKNLTYDNMGILIFNRWGDLVFSENPYKNQWNGTNKNGVNLPNTTYYYILTIDRSEGKFIKGDVLLVR